MTPENIKLSQRLVACIDLEDLPDGWLTHTTNTGGYPSNPAGTPFRVLDYAYLSDAVTEQMFGPIPERPHHNMPEETYAPLMKAHDDAYEAAWGNVLPDLEDAATIGCVLALLRTTWKDPNISTMADRGGWEVTGSPPTRSRSLGRSTEAEALVSAFEDHARYSLIKQLDAVRNRIRSYEFGDRPPSPPAALLREEREILEAIASLHTPSP